MAKRRYNLSPEGRAILQASARCIPKGSQTGPRTAAGKARSRLNGVKSGKYGRAGELLKEARRLAKRIAKCEAERDRLEAELLKVIEARRAWLAPARGQQKQSKI